MSKQQLELIFAKVCRSLGSEVKPAQMDTNLLLLGIDSLKTMECILAMEDTLGVELADEDLIPTNLQTPRTLLNVFRKRINGAVKNEKSVK